MKFIYRFFIISSLLFTACDSQSPIDEELPSEEELDPNKDLPPFYGDYSTPENSTNFILSSSDYLYKQEQFAVTMYGDTVLHEYLNAKGKEKEKKMCKYRLSNNIWNGGVFDGPYPREDVGFQGIFSKRGEEGKNVYPMGWYFSWKTNTYGVISYPAIIYGHRPWSTFSTDPEKLMAKLDDLSKLEVRMDVKMDAEYEKYSSKKNQIDPGYNLGIEVWLYDQFVEPSNVKPKGNVGHIHEFHIWLRRNSMFPAGSIVENDIEIDSDGDGEVEYYDLWDGRAANGRYTVFVLKTEKGAKRNDFNHQIPSIKVKKTVDVKMFLSYIREKGYLTNGDGSVSDYVGSVEFGTEIIRGDGFLSLFDYEVIVEKRK
ncbi:hypothetical protein DF185_16310 [Marinifilum breve]|uniref:Uncharacterized protein n=1 Tax=Marinifilum breve TaxID=2184082 RepID=A0A2V3ZVG7_9BACT|nr:hypothetical protein [Marinifilum breve]PXX98934.1 hypothetical protein DF185_16310 [Marinifilum breve]